MAYSPLARSATKCHATAHLRHFTTVALLYCHNMHLLLAVHHFCSCCYLFGIGSHLSAPAASWSFYCPGCYLHSCQTTHCTECACGQNRLQVVDAANVLIQDDERVGTILLVMAKHGIMEWVPAKQNLRPVSLAARGLFCHILSQTFCCVSDRASNANQILITNRRGA